MAPHLLEAISLPQKLVDEPVGTGQRLWRSPRVCGAITLTSSKAYGNWGQIFSYTAIASAILDRLLHRSQTITIRGESYRLREKRQAGLLQTVPPVIEHETKSSGE